MARDVRAVYEDEHARLWRALYAFGGSRDVADEAVAETFAQLLRRGGEVDDRRAWVWRSAFAIARGELRSRAVRPRTLTVSEADALSPRPDASQGSGEGLGRPLDALGAMSADDRELLVLCHVGGWRPTELAPLLAVSGPTLRVRLHRATRRARTLLEPEDT